MKNPIAEHCNGFEPAPREGLKVTVRLEGGPAIEMEYLGMVKYYAEDYGIFFPCGVIEGDSGELLIMRLVDDGGEGEDDFTFQTLDDPQLTREVYEVFKEHTADKYDFMD